MATHSVEPNQRHPDTYTPQRCPVCDANAVSSDSRTNHHGITHEHNVCAHNHGWERRWIAEVWPVAG